VRKAIAEKAGDRGREVPVDSGHRLVYHLASDGGRGAEPFETRGLFAPARDVFFDIGAGSVIAECALQFLLEPGGGDLYLVALSFEPLYPLLYR
jgi:hypothetical protein